MGRYVQRAAPVVLRHRPYNVLDGTNGNIHQEYSAAVDNTGSYTIPLDVLSTLKAGRGNFEITQYEPVYADFPNGLRWMVMAYSRTTLQMRTE